MNQQDLKSFFPASGISNKTINISEVKATSEKHILVGRAQLPLSDAVQKVVIYKITLDNGTEDLRVVSALCPHQGADISKDTLKPDGNVYCSLHRRPICIYSKYNQAYAVTLRDDEYVILQSG